MKQSGLIRKENWDYLIILDACRYDYFKECYEDYLEGKLSKAISPVYPEDDFATADWCKKVFTGKFEDVVYISSSPIINSASEVRKFEADKHFGKILDLWKSGWDEEVGTVPPQNVNEAVIKELNPDEERKMIIHYMQPHTPYINFSGSGKTRMEMPQSKNDIKYKIFLKLLSKTRKILGPERTRILGELLTRLYGGGEGDESKAKGILGELFGLPPINHLTGFHILREEGEEGLKRAYRDNLLLVLEEVEELVGKLSGTVVVTSDHGEMLGENNYYGHSYMPPHPVLNEVPWLEIG